MVMPALLEMSTDAGSFEAMHEKRITVISGSTRAPKVRALESVLRELEPLLGTAEVRSVDVASGVRETPLTRDEVMQGARNRVKALAAFAPGADFYVGLEGGLHVEAEEAWLENWACVSDGRDAYLGSGGTIPLPAAIAHEVSGRGRSLADVIDEFSGKHDVRSAEGTWGILTGGRITRQQAFQRALLNAFAPFYGPAFRR